MVQENEGQKFQKEKTRTRVKNPMGIKQLPSQSLKRLLPQIMSLLSLWIPFLCPPGSARAYSRSTDRHL